MLPLLLLPPQILARHVHRVGRCHQVHAHQPSEACVGSIDVRGTSLWRLQHVLLSCKLLQSCPAVARITQSLAATPEVPVPFVPPFLTRRWFANTTVSASSKARARWTEQRRPARRGDPSPPLETKPQSVIVALLTADISSHGHASRSAPLGRSSVQLGSASPFSRALGSQRRRLTPSRAL